MAENKCPKCGATMVEEFEYKPINQTTTCAIPTGNFSCLRCSRKGGMAPTSEKEMAEALRSATKEE